MTQPRVTLARAARARSIALMAHRYVGLVSTIFLVVAGLTGTLLVFYAELDGALNPELRHATPPSPGAPPLDPFELSARLQARFPDGQVQRVVRFDIDPGETLSAWLELGPERSRELFVDPYTGALLGARDWGDLSDGVTKNLMPFVYRLHYSLALDEVGTLLFGVIALLWTVDCFVGAYLTFPTPQRRGASARVSWLSRWLPAWRLHTRRLFSFVFTWHRASGLWIWALLLVFAWSAVGLNLGGVYRPVMATLAGLQPPSRDRLPTFEPPYPAPRWSMREAHAVGRELMASEARRRGFQVQRELWLGHHPEKGAFAYAVESSLDISSQFARTELFFDASDGHLLGFDARTGERAGNTITSWLYGLHFAAVWGLGYRLVVACVGVLIAALGVTGVWIWLRKTIRQGKTAARPRWSERP